MLLHLCHKQDCTPWCRWCHTHPWLLEKQIIINETQQHLISMRLTLFCYRNSTWRALSSCSYWGHFSIVLPANNCAIFGWGLPAFRIITVFLVSVGPHRVGGPRPLACVAYWEIRCKRNKCPWEQMSSGPLFPGKEYPVDSHSWEWLTFQKWMSRTSWPRIK